MRVKKRRILGGDDVHEIAGVDEASQLSLSNPMAINRGVATHDMAETAQRRARVTVLATTGSMPMASRPASVAIKVVP